MTTLEDMETPGFGFNPTDEQLVGHYLRHKIFGNDSQLSPIAEIDNICNHEPWDLRMMAAMPSKDTWYFFSRPDRKYEKSGHNNRVTRAGYWKVTGKVREIKNRAKSQVIGFKRILVFYRGRVRNPEWTNWTMHEYYLNPSCSSERDYVISRLHLKPPKKTVKSAVDEGEPGHESAPEVENPDTEITFPEIDPKFMEEFLNSNKQDSPSPTTLEPEMHMGLGHTYVNFQDTNTDDFSVPLTQFGISDQQYNYTESMKYFPDILDAQYDHGSVHTALDDSSTSESWGSRHMGNISDTEAVNGFSDDNGWILDWSFEHASA